MIQFVHSLPPMVVISALIGLIWIGGNLHRVPADREIM